MFLFVACTNGALRLVSSTNVPSVGRVEVCFGNIWGTICNRTWNDVAANIACRQLGYTASSMLQYKYNIFNNNYGFLNFKQVMP